MKNAPKKEEPKQEEPKPEVKEEPKQEIKEEPKDNDLTNDSIKPSNPNLSIGK